jgi:exoribonuclease R
MLHNWIAGTLELSSKVRYGMTGRGVPLFRFVPYDPRFSPMAVGCSQRNLFYNVHAIVEPSPTDSKKGSLIQNLGTPTSETELAVLLATYAFDSRKDLRPAKVPPPLPSSYTSYEPPRATFPKESTFHVDPPGCRDVDDSFTFQQTTDGFWNVAIHIADVAAWIPPDHPLDKDAQQRATSFYSPEGEVLAPMFPPAFSEANASLLPGSPKPTFSLLFRWRPGQQPTDFQWQETLTETSTSYTYDEAMQQVSQVPCLQALQALAADLGASPHDSHSWIAALMILYNKEAGRLLKSNGIGLLRKHSKPNQEKLDALAALAEHVPSLMDFAQESATFCKATDEKTQHAGLNLDAYAYATSPLRRYADLVNQRCLKAIVYSPTPQPPFDTLVESLNRRQKQAKAFQRDLFFQTTLAVTNANSVKGVVIQHQLDKDRYSVYVPFWKRIVKVRSLVFEPPALGSLVSLDWYDDRMHARWKERMVFKATLLADAEKGRKAEE